MDVHFTPDQEAKLTHLANSSSTNPHDLIKDAALRLLEDDARFRAVDREGISQADHGKFIEEAEMNARLEHFLRS